MRVRVREREEKQKKKYQAQIQPNEQKKGENSERNGRCKHPVRHTMLFSEPRTTRRKNAKKRMKEGEK